MRITLDAYMLPEPSDFHDRIAVLLDFPSYYGRNLDALIDLLSERTEPLELVVTNAGDWFYEDSPFYPLLEALFDYAKDEESFRFVLRSGDEE